MSEYAANDDRSDAPSICEQCGDTFSPNPGAVNRFCSYGCKYEAQCNTVTLTCPECGTRYTTPKSQEDHAGKFCSIECRDTHKYGDCPWRDADTLHELYVTQGLSLSETGDRLGCASSTVERWLKRHGIDTRSQSEGQRGIQIPELRDETLLRQLYIHERKSIRKVADQIGCSDPAVSEALEHHGIDKRPIEPGEKHPNWNGGRPTYGKGWTDEKREQIRERDGYKCQGCGLSGDDHKRQFGVIVSHD